MPKKLVQYTIRDVPDETDARIREEAHVNDISLNRATLRALERGLELTGQPLRKRNLRHLVSRPHEIDREAWAHTLAAMDTIDADDWK